MDRREFIKQSAMAAAGGLLLTTPLGQIVSMGKAGKNNHSKEKNNMRVLLINGSPHQKGNTFTSLSEAAKTLEQDGIETEIVQIGVQGIRGCIACGMCHRQSLG